MDIDLTGFSTTQKQALFDLLILAMYADGHLSSAEDEQLQKLLAAMGFVVSGQLKPASDGQFKTGHLK